MIGNILKLLTFASIVLFSSSSTAQVSKEKNCKLLAMFAEYTMEYRQSDLKKTETLERLEGVFEGKNDDVF